MSEIIQLDSPGVQQALAKRLAEDIDEYCAAVYDDGHRNHLGASLIGDECKRKLWYVFRWVKNEKFSGQMQRLFNRGHREEERFIEWLEGIGIKLWADDLENTVLWHDQGQLRYFITPKGSNECKEAEANDWIDDVGYSKQHIGYAKADGVRFPQYRIKDCGGHFGGSLDGVFRLPEHFRIDKPLLCEFKTKNKKWFTAIQKKGMVLAEPSHYAQTSVYGLKMGIEYVLYLVIHKDTDTIHSEVVKLDFELGQRMIAKANGIIVSQTPPPKISKTPTSHKCKFMCGFTDVCHKGAMAEKNCRSCVHCRPADDSQWFCEIEGDTVEGDKLLAGCDEHYKSITDAV